MRYLTVLLIVLLMTGLAFGQDGWTERKIGTKQDPRVGAADTLIYESERITGLSSMSIAIGIDSLSDGFSYTGGSLPDTLALSYRPRGLSRTIYFSDTTVSGDWIQLLRVGNKKDSVDVYEFNPRISPLPYVDFKVEYSGGAATGRYKVILELYGIKEE